MANEFQPYIMVHDKASETLVEKLGLSDTIILDITQPHFNGKNIIYDKSKLTRQIVKSFKGKVNGKIPLVVYGSGSFHHYTYGLCKGLADKRSQGYSYLHYDQHSDYGSRVDDRSFNNEVGCGDFVKEILIDTHAISAFLIGPTGIYPKIERAKVRNHENSFRKLQNLFNGGMSPEVYISIDLDVLKEGMITDWGMGTMSLNQILDSLTKVKERKKIIGADICGLSRNKTTDDTSIETYRRIMGRLQE